MIPLVVRTAFNSYFIVAKIESKESDDLHGLLNKSVVTPVIKNNVYKELFFSSTTTTKKSSFRCFHLIKWTRFAWIYGQTPEQKGFFFCTVLGDASAKFHS